MRKRTTTKPLPVSGERNKEEDRNTEWERRLRMSRTLMDNAQSISTIRNNINDHVFTPKQKIEHIKQTIPLLNESKIITQILGHEQNYQMVRYLAFGIYNITQKLRYSTMTKRDKEMLQVCIDELSAFKDFFPPSPSQQPPNNPIAPNTTS